MLRENTPQCRLANSTGRPFVKPPKMIGDLFSGFGDKHLLVRLEKQLDSFPRVAN